MPRNPDLVDFDVVVIEPGDNNYGYNGGQWGDYEVYIRLLDFGGRARPYNWMTVSREVARNLHRALGEFLAREAHSA